MAIHVPASYYSGIIRCSARKYSGVLKVPGYPSHLATEALLPPGHVFGAAFQYTCMKKTSVITVFGVNSKGFGFNFASGVQCNVPINCTIQILLLN